MIKYFVSVEWFGIVLRDPVTALTNLINTCVAFWCCIQVNKAAANGSVKTWRGFFFFMGLASLVALVVHGFSYYMSEATYLAIWMSMCLMQGLSVTFAQRATLQRYIDEPARKYWLMVPVVQFVVFAAVLAINKNFEVSKIQMALGLVPIMIWNAIVGFSGNSAARTIALGIFIASITTVIHGLKISISDWFNYNDISHVIIGLAFYVTCRGVVRGAATTETVRV